MWHLGYPEEALKVNREMLELARSIEHPFSLAYALHHTSWLYQYLRLPTEALAASGEQIRFAADQGFPLFHATGIVYEAGGLAAERAGQGGAPWVDKGTRCLSGAPAPRSPCLTISGFSGNALINSKRLKDADNALNKALAVAEESQERCHEAELHRLKGEIALSEGRNPDRAEGHFRRAIEIAMAQQSKAL